MSRARPASPLEQRRSLLTWNVLADAHIRREWYPEVPDAHLRGPGRARRVLSCLRRWDADVIALQEVSEDTWATLVAAFPAHGAAFVSTGADGLGLLVRGEVPEAAALPLPGGRMALLGTLRGGPRVAVVHLSYTPPDSSGPRQGVAELRAVCAAEPDLVVGDLNAPPGSLERAVLASAGFVDRSPPGPTFRSNGAPQALDAIATGPGWCAAAATLPALPASRPLPDLANPSDHLPLRASLWRNGGTRIPAPTTGARR